ARISPDLWPRKPRRMTASPPTSSSAARMKTNHAITFIRSLKNEFLPPVRRHGIAHGLPVLLRGLLPVSRQHRREARSIADDPSRGIRKQSPSAPFPRCPPHHDEFALHFLCLSQNFLGRSPYPHMGARQSVAKKKSRERLQALFIFAAQLAVETAVR